MEFSTGQPLAEYNRIYKETDQLYHNLALRMGLPEQADRQLRHPPDGARGAAHPHPRQRP